MSQIAGYTAADFLIQHASRERRSARVPASTWDAILSHIRDPADATRLADSAENRLLYCYAIPLYRHAADAGDENAAEDLAGLLAKRCDLDELRARADAGDRYAASELAEIVHGRPAMHSVRLFASDEEARAANRDRARAVQLAERGDLDGLRARTDAGDRYAAARLADVLIKQGRGEEAERLRRYGLNPDGSIARS